MTESRVSRHVSYEQVKRMLDFMESHADLANNDLSMAKGRQVAKELWGELTNGLNETKGGTKKSVNEWRLYWGDFRHKMRNKMLRIKNRRPDRVAVPLNRLERQAFKVLDPYFKKKEKRDKEMRVLDINKWAKELDDCNSTTTSSSGSSTTSSSSSSSTKSSDSSSSSYDSDSDSDEEPTKASRPRLDLKTFLPNWMAMVEHKRAEADLARARADEVYAQSAADAAHAAQAQADALTCLARATSAQADALERIASVLDRPTYQMIDI